VVLWKGTRVLFVGGDWAEDHHDIEIVDEAGQWLVKCRLAEGLAGLSTLHALIAAQLPEPGRGTDQAQVLASVKVGIETDRGPWVAALVCAGYEVFAVNPMQVARYRERHSTSGAKSDAADAHLLAEIVWLDREHHRPVAGDSAQAEAIKLVARAHQTAIWDRSRAVLRLRAALRDFFPAALEVFDDLDAPDALQLLAYAPDPQRAAHLSKAKITAVLNRAHRRNAATEATEIHRTLRAPRLRQPPAVQAAYAALVTTTVRLITELNRQINELGEVVADHFGRHPDAEIYLSQPGLGAILAARILGEFGDDPHRFADTKARKNHAGSSPITKASGTKRIVLARYARNKRLSDAVHQWAFCSLRGSPGATAYYQALRSRNIGHQAALGQLANRLVAILHGCLNTGTTYDQHTAWSHHTPAAA